jgi:tripartite-type tricarboxylate transporter receptor subunit TctC
MAPVARVGTGMYALVANPALPIKSISDLVAAAKSTPGKLNYASSGPGSATQLCSELLKRRAGIEVTQIVYKGAGDFLNGIMRGEVAFGCISVTAVKGLIDGGRLTALAVTGSKRSPVLPGVPTVAESGYPGFDMALTVGFFAPAATPKDVVERLNSDVRKVLGMAEVRERFAAQGVEANGSTPEELGAMLAGEVAQWADLIKAAGIRIEE